MKIKCLILLGLTLCLRTMAAEPPALRLYEESISLVVPPDRFVYNWRDAVLMKAFIDIYRTDSLQRERVADYVSSAMTRLAPSAHGRHPNAIAAACGLAFLKEAGRNTPETDAALERVWQQYKAIVRSADGGCSHRLPRIELWDDTLYMLDIFLLQFYRATGDLAYVEELADQVLVHAGHLRDTRTGLWYHGWTESSEIVDDGCCQKAWNANPQHRNSEFWGRGNGWVAMTLVDLLEVLPENHTNYQKIRRMYLKMMRTLRRLQDSRTGLWYQLPAHPSDDGNYLETSCSAMFAYAFEKGTKLGILPACYHKRAVKTLQGLDETVRPGDIELKGVCEGTCIGDKSYYYSRRCGGGQTYATGSYIMLQNIIYNQ